MVQRTVQPNVARNSDAKAIEIILFLCASFVFCPSDRQIQRKTDI